MKIPEENLLICYNAFPLAAEHIIDFPENVYTHWGVKRLHSEDVGNVLEFVEKVKDGDIIFIKTDFIIDNQFDMFIEAGLKDKKFSIITGGSDYNLGVDGDVEKFEELLNSDFILNWFCTNAPDNNHEKIHSIPIGFAEPNRLYSNQNILNKIKKNRKPFEEKENKLYLPWHDQNSNNERHTQILNIRKSVTEQEQIVQQAQKLSSEVYLHLISEHKFVICLSGNGKDTHRVYETLLCGSVPIILKNPITKLYDEYNLPYISLDSWEEINNESLEDFLSREFNFDRVDEFLSFSNHKQRIQNITNGGN